MTVHHHQRISAIAAKLRQIADAQVPVAADKKNAGDFPGMIAALAERSRLRQQAARIVGGPIDGPRLRPMYPPITAHLG